MSERVSNTELADLLGLSHVQVSRLRSGNRYPGIPSMRQIEKVLGWSAGDQMKAHGTEKYAQEFEAAIERYASDRDNTAGPVERPPDPQ